MSLDEQFFNSSEPNYVSDYGTGWDSAYTSTDVNSALQTVYSGSGTGSWLDSITGALNSATKAVGAVTGAVKAVSGAANQTTANNKAQSNASNSGLASLGSINMLMLAAGAFLVWKMAK